VVDAPDTESRGYVRHLLDDFELTFAVLAAVSLGVADELKDGPRTVDDLAEQIGADVSALTRLMRMLASRGVFNEQTDGRFILTEAAEPLRADAPDGVRRQALWQGSESYLRTWSALTPSVRTGECAFERIHGQPFFDYLASRPELSRIFNDLMTLSSGAEEGEAIITSHDFGAYRRVVDVGGGDGALLSLILNRYPDVHGVLYDAPAVIATPDEQLNHLVVTGRASTVGGDFFQAVPPGGDAYVLKYIVHDWDDQAATTILDNCRKAMPDDGKVLLVEIIRPAGQPIPESSFLDLTMLLFLHGRERTEAEYRELIDKAGLRMVNVTATGSPFSIIEATPDAAPAR
jgi:O-methyltransferase domain/Dimerisation domain